MGCGICEHNATDCECTHHEQAAYEKGRSEAQAEIARLQAELTEWKSHAIKRAQERNVAFNRVEALQLERDTAWNDALEAAYGAAEVYPEEYRMNEYDEGFIHGGIAARDAIRALRRPT